MLMIYIFCPKQLTRIRKQIKCYMLKCNYGPPVHLGPNQALGQTSVLYNLCFSQILLLGLRPSLKVWMTFPYGKVQYTVLFSRRVCLFLLWTNNQQ